MKKIFTLLLIYIIPFLTTNAQDVYWPSEIIEINTGVNATYLVQSANIDSTPVIFGYVLGAFYTDEDGNLKCGGFTNASSGQVQLAVMGDDTTTDQKDGFYEGETITWLAYASFAEQTYNATVSFITSPPFGSDSYSTNGLNVVASFNISSAVLGCMDATACNYNDNATEDDTSCTFAEINYNCDGSCIDTDEDSVCDTDEVEGCMDVTACNYNELATNDDNSCTAPETNFDCAGNCLNDTDNDGICDENEIPGCSDMTACNYDATATDLDESCTFTTGCESCEAGLIIDNDDDEDGVCNDNEIDGCTDPLACNYNTSATEYDGESCVYATGDCDTCSGETNGTGTVIDNDADNDGVCNDDEEGACLDDTACNYNSNPIFEEDNTLCLYTSGNCDTCSGEEDGTGTIIDNDTDNDGICNAAEIEGCTDETACNFNEIATDLDASCVYTSGCETCENGSIIANDDDQDGICNIDEVVGCFIMEACNYNENATDSSNEDCIYTSELNDCDECSGETDGTGTVISNDTDNDGICNAAEIEGCSDISACNYNQNATDPTACIFVDEAIDCQICSGDTDGTGTVLLNDTDLDGVCDDLEVFGCTNTLYTAYSALATELDESCETLVILGCTDSLYLEYFQPANTDNGTCTTLIVLGCTDTTADNYSNEATSNNGSCEFTACPYPDFYEYNHNYTIADGSLCLTLIVDGCTNEAAENYTINANLDDGTCVIYGCMNTEADNFSPTATLQDDSCIMYGCTNETASNFDDQANENDGSCIIYGCTISIFPNYNPEATIEDVSCSFDGVEVFGCTDEDALNYYSQANTDNGTCTYDNATAVCEYTIQEEYIPLYLPLGWGMFGYTCIEPIDVSEAFASIANLLNIVKDNDGEVYIPEYNYNSLGDLVYSRGYQIYTTEEITDFSFCPTILISEQSSSPQYQIGDLVEGGIVFYVDESGEHGLVAALGDITEGSNMGSYGLPEGFEWGCYGTNISGASGTDIGTGYQNTLDIVAQNCQTNNGGITAAQATLNYTSEGFTDWYLPSKEELQEMCNTIGNGGSEGNLGGFETSGWSYYWSSSEYSNHLAWGVYFYSGNPDNVYKDGSLRVRAVRAF